MGVTIDAQVHARRCRATTEPGAIAARENVHFYLMAFARASQIPMSGSKEQGVAEQVLPRGRRLGRRARLSSTRKRIQEN